MGFYVHMSTFLSILIAVMTLTVESKSKVSGSGEFPYDVEISYTNTGRKGSVTANDTATLRITNFDGLSVEAVDVYIRSNQSSGAGVLTMDVNGAQVAKKEGSFKQWTGNWDNTNYHAISLLSSTRHHVDEMTIRLVGTESSLHIEKYVITYKQPLPRTVTLKNADNIYTTLTETTGLAGVTLPQLADREGWSFVGWTPTECWNIEFMPEMYAAGTKYYPSTDTTLWALWRKADGEIPYATELQTGEYLYVETTQLHAMSGIPESGIAGTAVMNAEDVDQVYLITFDETAQTATIRHQATGYYIGYSGTQLAATQSTWQVWHGGDKTIFYATISGKIYALMPKLYDGTGNYEYAGLVKTNESALSGATTALLPLEEANRAIYTCHPEVGLGIDIVEEKGEELEADGVIYIGNYQLIIRNGKKYIRL